MPERGRRALIVTAVAACAVVASIAPLAAYVLSLALFGLPHVLAELRFVDARFSPRLGGGLRPALAALLGALVMTRIAALGGFLGDESRRLLELGILATMVVLLLPLIRRSAPIGAALVVTTFLLLLLGGLVDPALALVLLAVLHNLSPLGFLAEARRGDHRRGRSLAGANLVFLVVPLIVASGLIRRAAGDPNAGDGSYLLAGAGSLAANLGAFVPTSWADSGFARDLFAAAVYLQLVHYGSVLHVLPRLLDDEERHRARRRWPEPGRFAVILAVIGSVSLLAFGLDFGASRQIYGVFAAVHAWIEVPVLLQAALRPPRPVGGLVAS